MENLKNNKIYKFLFINFIVFSLIHIIYATCTLRGLYMDGSFYSISLLDNIANDRWIYVYDNYHPRFIISMLMQTPMLILGIIGGIEDKFTLLYSYVLPFFLFPFLALIWNFKLSQRTNRIDVLFWSVFAYGLLILPFSVASVVETILGAIFHFVLWNYLVSDISYKKRDMFLILFLIISMFATYEYVSLLGIIFFLASIYYVIKVAKTIKSKLIKSIIGCGSLCASLFNIFYMIKIPDEGGEIMRFIKESYDFLPYVLDMNSLITIVSLLLLIIFCFCKKNMNTLVLFVIIAIYIGIIIKLLLNVNASVIPMWENHLRTVPCWALPLIFISMWIKDIVSKEINSVKYNNLIIVTMICCIFHTAWQYVNTYYWYRNIEYMKMELMNEKSSLYIPSDHEQISDFFNPEIRRYIWHGSYPATSIAFSDTYEQKTLLLTYDIDRKDGNVISRKELYYDKPNNKISIPFGVYVDVKNPFWDLTKCANALYEYNKENNIKTDK